MEYAATSQCHVSQSTELDGVDVADDRDSVDVSSVTLTKTTTTTAVVFFHVLLPVPYTIARHNAHAYRFTVIAALFE